MPNLTVAHVTNHGPREQTISAMGGGTLTTDVLA